MPRQVPAKTLKILRRKDGVLQARLSPDLNAADEVGWYVDREEKKLIVENDPKSKLTRLKVWPKKRNKGRSAYIGAVSFANELGLDPSKLKDKTLDVKVEGKHWEVQF